MTVRELIDVLGAGNLDAEVWVGVPLPAGGLLWRPLECVEDRIEAGAGAGRVLLLGVSRDPQGSAKPSNAQTGDPAA